MTHELDTAIVQEHREFWSAALTVDGVLTTFSCNHNHKTPNAARKCTGDVLSSARKFTWHPEFEEVIIDTSDWGVDDERPLVEWRRPNVSARFRRAK